MKGKMLVKVKRVTHKVAFSVKKHSPEILLISGIVGGVVSAVMACKASTKVGEIIQEKNDALEGIEKYSGDTQINEETGEEEVLYSEQEAMKDKVMIYTEATIKVIKLYAPAITLGTLSVVSLLASNKIMRKRAAALATAYAALDESFKSYRKRVENRFGKEVEQEIRNNLVTEKVTDENGEEKLIKVTKKMDDNPYTLWFDSHCEEYNVKDDANMFFLRVNQRTMNDQLQAHGYVFLNDVLKALGAPLTKAGQVIGWSLDNPKGDGYIDFRIEEVWRPIGGDPKNGREKAILLNFNADGDIIHNDAVTIK